MMTVLIVAPVLGAVLGIGLGKLICAVIQLEVAYQLRRARR